MGLRERLLDLLNRGGSDEPDRDPGEFIEIAIVPLSQAPVLVAGLEEAGIAARFVERWSVITKTLVDAGVYVARSDAAAAKRVLEGLGSQ